MSNTNLIIACAMILFFLCSCLYFFAKGKKQAILEEELSTFDEILDAIKAHMVDLIRDDGDDSSTDEEFIKTKKRKAQIDLACKNASYGIESAKLMLKGIIRTFLKENVSIEKVEQILGLDNESEPSTRVMFEILMYRYKKAFGKNALSMWMKRYKFDEPRTAVGIGKKGDISFYITKSNLEESYHSEYIVLEKEEKYDILALLLFQDYKGFGMLDTISEMNINGFNLGVSGSVMDSMQVIRTHGNKEVVSEATNSLWLYYGGQYIHLQFLDFGTEDEIKRIIQLLIRYNSPGPLTAKRGFLVNTMADKSRILAIRPPVGEYWAVFVRKFTLDNVTPEALIIKKGVTGGEICIKLIEFLMRGLITIAVTGRQGSGKTTLMKSIIAFYDRRYNLGVLEMAPEMYLRELYTDRNIISVQETDYVSAEHIQDALKKADRGITIIGEVATDPVAARMIQLGMTGSLATLFSHHANEAKDLVLTLRNSLVNAGGFSNMTTAERQVTSVVKMNIHLDLTADGKRYIKRITEIIQLDEGIPYPDYDSTDPQASMAEISKEYYIRQTDRISFETRDILVYDEQTDTYLVNECMSDVLYQKILSTLPYNESKEFTNFIDYYWKKKEVNDYYGVEKYTGSKSEEELNELLNEDGLDDMNEAIYYLKKANDLAEFQYGFHDMDME
ncbi:ATPase, T2SS/T4P/T4SS family [Clostridium sp. Marseille-P299]|uniref:ATPase, T2SS/T4P/T4SS family n=1 Tax=Clostridium sp. Marseille-P299 TaxID=1805477 RepID=UPI000832CE72|nr:ATPase, T2SS/T4P/T4SS family [Clostridium sp. Marseille-P299]